LIREFSLEEHDEHVGSDAVVVVESLKHYKSRERKQKITKEK